MKNSLQTLFSKTSLFMAFSFFASTSYVAADCNDACPLYINGQGSTLLAPWVEASAASYDAKTSSYIVTYNTNSAETGSGNGILQLQAGDTYFGGTDVAPTCAQSVVQPPAICACACPIGTFPNRILTFPVAIAGTAIGFNQTLSPGTTTLDLTAAQLAGIFTGHITNWSSIPGAGTGQITVVYRTDSSGDTNNFTTFLSEAAPTIWTTGPTSVFPVPSPLPIGSVFLGKSGNAGVVMGIESTPGAIGYLGYGFTQPPLSGTTAIPVAAVQNSSGAFISPTVASIGLAATGICIPFDLSISTINTTNPAGYPIASPTNLIAYEYQPTACAACEVANWLFYMGTTAQSTAASFFLAPLPSDIQQQYLNNLSFIKECGAGNFIPGSCTSGTGRSPFGFSLVNNNGSSSSSDSTGGHAKNRVENTDSNTAAAAAAAAALNANLNVKAKKSFNKKNKKRSHSHSSHSDSKL